MLSFLLRFGIGPYNFSPVDSLKKQYFPQGSLFHMVHTKKNEKIIMYPGGTCTMVRRYLVPRIPGYVWTIPVSTKPKNPNKGPLLYLTISAKLEEFVRFFWIP